MTFFTWPLGIFGNRLTDLLRLLIHTFRIEFTMSILEMRMGFYDSFRFSIFFYKHFKIICCRIDLFFQISYLHIYSTILHLSHRKDSILLSLYNLIKQMTHKWATSTVQGYGGKISYSSYIIFLFSWDIFKLSFNTPLLNFSRLVEPPFGAAVTLKRL